MASSRLILDKSDDSSTSDISDSTERSVDSLSLAFVVASTELSDDVADDSDNFLIPSCKFFFFK